MYRLNGVTVYAVLPDLKILSRVQQQVMHTFQADWTIVTEDRSCLWLELALEHNPRRVIYLAHSQATLPFGPEAFERDSFKTAVYARLAHIIVVSTYMQDYLARWGDLASDGLRFPAYGQGPYPFLANFEAGYVTMINPSLLKGAPIFSALAKSMPETEFAVVPSWGTTVRDRTLLETIWTFQHTDNGWYRVISQASNKVIDVAANSVADGANIQQWTAGTGANQQWRIETLGDGSVRLVARHSGKVLDVAAGSAADGANIQQWTWNSSNAQRFLISN